MRYRQFFTPEPLPDAIGRSEFDSNRFGLSIGRLELGAVDERHTPERIRELILASGHDLVILRYPSAQADWFARLLDPAYTLIHADTLIYWSRPLHARDAAPALTYPVTTEPDLDVLDALVRRVFADYTNHYASNPKLSGDDALDGYVEWARTWATHPARGCLLLGPPKMPLGLVTVDVTDGTAEIALVGTAPDVRDKGVAGQLMRAAQAWAVQRGGQSLVISTQAQNVRVQRVWAREGYRPTASLNTLHVQLSWEGTS